jgi:Magnesium chelatase, subunit ChlI
LALASIRSAAGRLPGSGALTTVPPLIAPHHSTSMPALIGGGTGLPRPGAVSLAHTGLTDLDRLGKPNIIGMGARPDAMRLLIFVGPAHNHVAASRQVATSLGWPPSNVITESNFDSIASRSSRRAVARPCCTHRR